MRHLPELLLVLAFGITPCTLAQTFSSGSTGADGALDCPANGQANVQLPNSGILNYTTVNVESGCVLTFSPNLNNTPVIMLAQAAVNIAGTISVSAHGQNPGPGGFRGGDPGQPGWGPGGGQIGGIVNGQWTGPLSLVPIIGGSGGAGSDLLCGNGYSYGLAAGGGGGGAVTIASSSSISVTGQTIASGDIAASVTQYIPACYGSSGAGGAIRLVANAVSVSGILYAANVRLEAPLANNTYTGSGTAPVRSTINPLIAPSLLPSITFSSIGGYAVPSYSGSSFSTIDLMLPTQLQDPIPIIVNATNVPVGSKVTVSFSGPGGPTLTTGVLSGTSASSTATLYVSGLSRSGVTYLFALATFDPTLMVGNLKQAGPDAVARVELAAAPGGPTRFRFLRRDGSEVSLSKVHVEMRRAFGL